jgi:hypothetical protein
MLYWAIGKPVGERPARRLPAAQRGTAFHLATDAGHLFWRIYHDGVDSQSSTSTGTTKTMRHPGQRQ